MTSEQNGHFIIPQSRANGTNELPGQRELVARSLNTPNAFGTRGSLAEFDNPVFDVSDNALREISTTRVVLPTSRGDLTSSDHVRDASSPFLIGPAPYVHYLARDAPNGPSDLTMGNTLHPGPNLGHNDDAFLTADGTSPLPQYSPPLNGQTANDTISLPKTPDEKTQLNNDKHFSNDKRTSSMLEVPHEGLQHKSRPERETWGKKFEFLLAVIGFAVDLGNVWRFPYICYRNGGGAFLIPYLVMLIFGGLPLFYMELALGQFQRCGCITVWKRICPMFKGIGFGICFIATYVAFYYNTIIAWALYYMFASMRREVPWISCNNEWNTNSCVPFFNRTPQSPNDTRSPAEEFFTRSVLEVHRSTGIDDVGPIKWSIALCLLLVFLIVYFSLWKGIKSSGKAVWVTATMPYIVLLVLLVRGVTLDGSLDGIIYYLKPQWHKLSDIQVWNDAAAQIFFSLGPGFGVLLALSSYNKFHNNCYKDALITSSINCATSFLAGFVVFSVLGYMAKVQGKDIDKVADEGPGLVFVAYPEAIAQLELSSVWSIIFFFMLVTLGLDSTFGGLEAMITGICDEWPNAIGRRREIFVGVLILYCFLGGLSTTTYGGSYVLNLLDQHGAPISILFIVFVEAIAVNWFYGVNRFSRDIEEMLGSKPGIFWRVCWAGISPIFLLMLFLSVVVMYRGIYHPTYMYPPWAEVVGWMITCSSLFCVPIYATYFFFFKTKGSVRERLRTMVTPEEEPRHGEPEMPMQPVYL